MVKQSVIFILWPKDQHFLAGNRGLCRVGKIALLTNHRTGFSNHVITYFFLSLSYCVILLFNILTNCEVKMAGYWPSTFLHVSIKVHKLVKKRMRPISSHHYWTSLVDKGFIIWHFVAKLSCDLSPSFFVILYIKQFVTLYTF